MIIMTELERRAMMGDRQAQEEYARQGILLPCPFCGGAAQIIRFRDYGWKQFKVSCDRCFMSFGKNFYDEKKAIEQWNTRPAPPVGHCGECRFADTKDGGIYCELDDYQREEYEFCSEFEPKGGEENG